MLNKISTLKSKLSDNRGKKVIFVSHCLLNENTRYLGGAFRVAGVDELIDQIQKLGIGIVQMPCPEQKAWGGVLKKEMLRGYCIKGAPLSLLRSIYVKYFIWKTKNVYRKIAQEVVSQMKDYQDSGYEVVGIIGIKGSPSCGISASLDLAKSSETVANLSIEDLNAQRFNDKCYKDCLVSREGLFFEQLQNLLSSRNLRVSLFEHDLITEMEGKMKVIDLLEKKG